MVFLRGKNALYLCLVIIGVFLFITSCIKREDEGSGEIDVKTEFGQWNKNTYFDYKGDIGLSGFKSIKGGLADTITKTIKNIKYDHYKVGGDIADNGSLGDPLVKGTDIYVNITPDNTSMTLGGVKDNGFLSKVLPIPDLDGKEIILDSPVVIKTNLPLNTPLTLNLKGKAKTATDTVGKNVNLVVTYTVTEDNVSVNTKIGNISGCKHITATGVASGDFVPSILKNISVSGELWYHPKLGTVAFNVPLLNLSSGLAGESDYGTATIGPNVIKKTQILDSGAITFDLNTYDRAKLLDADKMTHAKMFLELRYADTNDAKNKSMPDAYMYTVQFATAWGTFPFSLAESPISIFHPEENGKGFKYWYAYVDQAAKNEPGSNGILYHVGVNLQSKTLTPVRATSRIGYNIIGAGEF